MTPEVTSWNAAVLNLPLLPQVSATDEDRGSFGAVSYALGPASGGSPPGSFTLGKESGRLCTSTPLDRDGGPDKFDLTVTATDGVRAPSGPPGFSVSLALAASLQDESNLPD